MDDITIAQLLDLSIKRAETNGAREDQAYEINGRRYKNYVDNDTWKAFVNEMKTMYYPIYENFAKGAGDELGIKKVGPYPPKMASYGSSSRMLYLLARNIPGFCFEKKLYTTVGGKANLDGFLCVNGSRIYVEAKCREPYNSPNRIIDRKYEELYRCLNRIPRLAFHCDITILNEKEMKVDFTVQNTVITRFDIKQMICHLLGIATEQITAPSKDHVRFIYLLFDPTHLQIEDEPRKDKLLSIYRQETTECDAVPFAALYKAIVTYLSQHPAIKPSASASIEQIANNFSFSRCDQVVFRERMK